MPSTRPREEVSSTGGLQGQKGPHNFTRVSLWVSRGAGAGGIFFSGVRDPSAQRGVNFSVVVVPLVLFLLPFFVEKWGWAGRCCGVV